MKNAKFIRNNIKKSTENIFEKWEYWSNHKEKQKEKAKRYYELNREKIVNYSVNIIEERKQKKAIFEIRIIFGFKIWQIE